MTVSRPRTVDPLPIPIGSAREIGEKYGYDQVVIVARAVSDETHNLEGTEHCTTWGRDKPNCDVAARIGNFLKYKVMGWVRERTKYEGGT